MKTTLGMLAFILNAVLVNAQYTVLHYFNDTTGKSPTGSLISDGTYLYGMTPNGGSNNYGVIFKIKPDGTNYDTLLNFNGINGRNPLGDLYYDGAFLYGMTQLGGTHDSGLVFKIKTDGTSYDTLLNFNSANGSVPQFGSLISDGTYLYGATKAGGINYAGVIFKIKPNGQNYTKLLDFTASNGNPFSSLIYDGTYLYGNANNWSNATGNVFKLKTNGTSYTNLNNFTGNGEYSYASLLLNGTSLYGTLYTGCSGYGGIFKVDTSGGGNTILNFNRVNGGNATGSLISDGSYLYGMSTLGGNNLPSPFSDGVIFKIKPDGTDYTIMYYFDRAHGGISIYGSLYTDGTFLYGMTEQGGIGYDSLNYASSSYRGDGVIFKLDKNAVGVGISQYNNNKNNSIIIYPNPSSGSIHITGTTAIDELKITDLLGQTVYETKPHAPNKELILDNAGVYFVTVTCGGEVTTKKVIVNK